MAIEWIKNRLVEPSTWVAVGVALVGIGALSNIPTIAIVGIVISGGGFFLKEKGKK
jgi:hypothetical protein|tara:strand:+ start:2066 stop:2233 length:168 start_codon:yes stop_codon:yes gene_type:complete